jgi:hypothetical protein
LEKTEAVLAVFGRRLAIVDAGDIRATGRG